MSDQFKPLSTAPTAVMDAPVTRSRNRAPNSSPQGVETVALGASQSLSDSLYRGLRASIMSVDLLPGTPISENDIARSKGVSRTPVRAAILRLADEALVEVVPKSGTFVGRIPLSALPEASIARRTLEMMIVQSAARLATSAQIDLLKANIEEQFEMVARDDISGFHEQDSIFHKSIAEIGQLPKIWKFIETIKTQIDRFRRLTLPHAGRMAQVADEHARIFAAIAAGDEEKASQEMHRHLSGLQNYFANGVAAHPQYFIQDIDLSKIPNI